MIKQYYTDDQFLTDHSRFTEEGYKSTIKERVEGDYSLTVKVYWVKPDNKGYPLTDRR